MKTERTMVQTQSHRFLLPALLLVLATGMGVNSCDVQCGDVLDVDHGRYKLAGDLRCPFRGGPAVTITGEGVLFDLNGYTITRNNTTGTLLEEGIRVSGANAHIKNGSIVDINCPARANEPLGGRDCAAIILSWKAAGVMINRMSLHNNNVGIGASSIANADKAWIFNNDITGNLRLGIGLFGSADGATITGNDLSDTGGFPDGFGANGHGYLGSSDGVNLVSNVANGCARAGIALFGSLPTFPPAQLNTIRYNTTRDNGSVGISLLAFTELTAEADRPHDNVIANNTSLGNGTRDLFEGIGAGGDPFGDCLNTWKDNDFDFADPDCIE